MTRKKRQQASERMKQIWAKRKANTMGPPIAKVAAELNGRDLDTVVSIVSLMDDLPQPYVRYIIDRFS